MLKITTVIKKKDKVIQNKIYVNIYDLTSLSWLVFFFLLFIFLKNFNDWFVRMYLGRTERRGGKLRKNCYVYVR